MNIPYNLQKEVVNHIHTDEAKNWDKMDNTAINF